MRARRCARFVVAAMVGVAATAAAGPAPRPDAAPPGTADARWLTSLEVRYGLATLAPTASAGGTLPVTRTDTVSLLLDVGYEFDDRFGVQVTIPFIMGTAVPEGGARTYGPAGFGNVAVTSSFRFQPLETLALRPRAMLAVPTARGDADGTVDEVQRFSLSRGAAVAWGSRDAALFEAGRMGGLVGLTADWTASWFSLRAWLDVVGLFDVRGPPLESGRFQSTAGAGGTVALGRGFGVSLGFAASWPWTPDAADHLLAVSLDAGVEWHFGPGWLALATVVPVFSGGAVGLPFGAGLAGGVRY